MFNLLVATKKYFKLNYFYSCTGNETSGRASIALNFSHQLNPNLDYYLKSCYHNCISKYIEWQLCSAEVTEEVIFKVAEAPENMYDSTLPLGT